MHGYINIISNAANHMCDLDPFSKIQSQFVFLVIRRKTLANSANGYGGQEGSAA